MSTKTNKIITGISLFICLGLLISCGGKSKSPDENTGKDSLSQGSQADTLYVWVENLRARKEPGANAEVIMELKAGTVLIDLKEKSSFKDKVTLRGKSYEEPWLKVKLPNGSTGWVFGGAVTSQMEEADGAAYLLTPGVSAGKFKLGVSKADLLKQFPGEVVEGMVPLAEGDEDMGLIIYKGTENQIDVYLDDQGKTFFFSINGVNTKWHTEQGLTVGTTLQELVNANGKPIGFSGFDWDYGGNVLGFNGGNLEKFYGILHFRLTHDGDIGSNLSGDQLIQSTTVKNTDKIYVDEISISAAAQ